ncbi:MAG: molybdopterin-dependent oxidoreductase, partial [Pseudomonadota bacterium]
KLDNAFVVYQGHHGDRAAHKADVILPGAAYTEKDGIYANTEGRPQLARRAGFPPGDAKEDWRILRALSAKLGAPLGYDDLRGCRDRLFVRAPALAAIDQAQPADWGAFGTDAKPDAAPFAPPIHNYWMTDPISRASETMAACYEAFLLERDKTAAAAGAAE